ncbi:MAG: hypothetical protein ABI835_14295, partial [Chloroflexota bacterium]
MSSHDFVVGVGIVYALRLPPSGARRRRTWSPSRSNSGDSSPLYAVERGGWTKFRRGEVKTGI